jgi:hypothetical protein
MTDDGQVIPVSQEEVLDNAPEPMNVELASMTPEQLKEYFKTAEEQQAPLSIEEESSETHKTQPEKPQAAIPKPRFDEVREERDKAREEAAYYRGQLEAAKSKEPEQQADKDFDVLSALKVFVSNAESEKDEALAELEQRYNDGDLEIVSVPQYLKQVRKIEQEFENKQNYAIRKEQEEIAKRSTPSSETIQQRLESNPDFVEKRDQLLGQDQHWLQNVPSSLHEKIAERASERLREQGFNAAEPTAEMRLRFLKEVITVSGDEFNYRKTATSSPQQAQQKTQTNGTSPISQKLDLAAKHPPNIAAAGNASVQTDSFTDKMAQTTSMGDLAKLIDQMGGEQKMSKLFSSG